MELCQTLQRLRKEKGLTQEELAAVEAVIPVEMQGKNYTGEEKSQWSINFFGRRIEIFGNSSLPLPPKIA